MRALKAGTALAGITLLIAGCGGSPASAGTSSRGSAQLDSQQAAHLAAFAACMRARGVAHLPAVDGNERPGANGSEQVDLKSPAFKAAIKTCLPTAGGTVGANLQPVDVNPTGPKQAPVTSGTAPTSGPLDCDSVTTCYAPKQIEVAYGIQPLLERGIDGRGETVVLPELAETQPLAPVVSDLRPDRRFDRVFGLPAARLKVVTSIASSASPWLANGEPPRVRQPRHLPHRPQRLIPITTRSTTSPPATTHRHSPATRSTATRQHPAGTRRRLGQSQRASAHPPARPLFEPMKPLTPQRPRQPQFTASEEAAAMQTIQPPDTNVLSAARTPSRRTLPVAAAIVTLALLAAGCGSSSPAGPNTGSPASFTTAAFKYSSCMRDQGLSSFPDPSMTDHDGQQVAYLATPSSLIASPAFKTANTVCQKILTPVLDTTPNLAVQATREQHLTAFAKCMRSHGAPGFPDPTSQGQLTQQMITSAGVDLHAPAVFAAVKTCLPAAGGEISAQQVERAPSEAHNEKPANPQ